MEGEEGLGNPHELHELTDAPLSVHQALENPKTLPVGESLKSLGYPVWIRMVHCSGEAG